MADYEPTTEDSSRYQDLLIFRAEVLASLSRLAAAAERQATAAERLCRVIELANEIDLDAEPGEPEPVVKRGQPDPHAAWTDDQEESYAAIETLEEAGVRVPPEAYKRLGLDPPEREDEPTAEELDAAQPGSDDDEPVTARSG